LTFRVKAHEVGERYEKTSSLELRGELEIRGNPLPVDSTEKQRYTVEYLAISGKEATQARVRYDEFTDTDDLRRTLRGQPTVGRSYLLHRKNGVLVINDVDGGSVDAPERGFLEKELGRFGEPSNFTLALDGKTVRPGDRLPDIAKGFAADVSAGDKEVRSVEMTFAGTEQDRARIDYEIETVEQSTMVMKRKGSLFLDVVSGRLLEDRSNATLDGAEPEKRMTMKVTAIASTTIRPKTVR
jgi:hypothetical protein